MTITATELALYAGALCVLFVTPGPVWLAVIARTLSGGVGAAVPLALGVTVGDALWPLLAIFGVSWLVAQIAWFLDVLRIVGAVMFVGMGIALIRNAGHGIAADSRMTRPGGWSGFLAGVAVILGNPKAILFYMGLLPNFFDLRGFATPDIAAVIAVSMAIPLLGNLLLAAFVDRARRLLASEAALRRTNVAAGGLLILVGLALPFV